MPTRRNRILAALAMATVIVVATACTANRSEAAEQIRREVQTMPGVAASHVGYINDFENGANLNIDLDMVNATDMEISGVAGRINELTGDRFDDHRRTTTFKVADRAALEYGADLDPTQVAADARVLRVLRPHASAGHIIWKHTVERSRLEMWNAATPDSDLKAALHALPFSSTVAYVRSSKPAENSSWEVALPLTPSQMDAITQVRDRLPVTVYQLNVHDGRISELSVNLGDPRVAYQNAQSMMAALAPTQAHPITVEWRLSDGASAGEGTVG